MLIKYVSNPKHATIIADLCAPRILRSCFTFIPISILVSNYARTSKIQKCDRTTIYNVCVLYKHFFSELHKIPAFQRIPCCKVLVHYYRVRNVMTFMRSNSPALKKREVLQNVLKTHYRNMPRYAPRSTTVIPTSDFRIFSTICYCRR